MDSNKIKKIFAITFTAVSIGAVIVANNKKTGFPEIPVIENSFVQKPMLAMAKSSLRAENSFAEGMIETQMEHRAVMEAPAEPSLNPSEKKKIRNADVNLQAENLSETFTAIEEWVKHFNGYISSSHENTSSINITAHIPADSFDQAMESCGSLGKITNKSINERDVTDQYYDLNTRIENKRILVNKFQEYLKKANNVKEILQVESQLANTTAELENLQGQMNRMSKEISFSQVHFYAQLPASRNEDGIILPDTKSEFSEFISNIVNFGLHYVWSILYIAIYGTLVVLLFLFIYWICFGKLGLVRKLFNKIK